MKIRQAIHIGRNVTDIMQLPCVFSCHKDADNSLVYLLYDWNEQWQYIEARQGDWLCQYYWTNHCDPETRELYTTTN